MHEVKIMLDEMEFLSLTEEAAKNHRSLRAQAKHMVVGGGSDYYRRPKPKRFVSAQVYDEKLDQFISVEDAEGRN